jgi:hypothetical protein
VAVAARTLCTGERQGFAMITLGESKDNEET